MEKQSETYVAGGVLVVPMPKELDHHSSVEIRDNLDLMLAARGIRRVLLDFSKTEFMDSAGIGVVLGKYRKVKAFGGQVSVCGANDRIMRIMRMSGIGQIVTFYPTPGQALEAKR